MVCQGSTCPEYSFRIGIDGRVPGCLAGSLGLHAERNHRGWQSRGNELTEQMREAQAAINRRDKMNQAMSTYSQSGSSSSVNPQVNIKTGPVTQMDGTNYETTSDLQAATASAVRQGANMALSQLQNNPNVRRQVGVRP